MKKRTAILLLLSAPSLFAQAPDTLWTRTYGGSYWDEGYSVLQTDDGGYIACGETDISSTENYQVYIVKTDSSGDSIWTKKYGGDYYDGALCIKELSGGGYIIAGKTDSYGAGYHDMYVLRINMQGDTLWTRTYGGSDFDCARDIDEIAGSGYIIAGYSDSFSDSFGDIYVVRTDINGNFMWSKTFGGPNTEEGNHVQQTFDGGFIIAGWTNSFGAYYGDFYLIKTNVQGDTQWTKRYGGDNADICFSAAQTSDTGFIMVGYTNSFGNSGWDVYLVKTKSNGDTMWTRSYGGIEGEVGFSVQQTEDDGYIISGGINIYLSENTDLYLLRLDSLGDLLWSATYGDTNHIEEGFCVRTASDDGYIICGYKEGLYTGDRDMYLIKTTPDNISVQENKAVVSPYRVKTATIIHGPLRLPANKTCRVFDIAGRAVMPNMLKPGIYFIEIDRVITGKVIKVR